MKVLNYQAAILIVLQWIFLALSVQASGDNRSEILLLEGTWQKTTGQHLLPVGDLEGWEDVQIPEQWPIDLMRNTVSDTGVNPRIATYVYELPFTSSRSGLYLNVGEIYSAFDLYVSNQAGSFSKVASNGDITFPNKNGRAVLQPIALPEIPAHARLVFQLSAAGYPSTRIMTIPMLGKAADVDSRIWTTRVMAALISGGFIAIAIYNLFLWASGSRRRWEYFAVAIFAITIMIRVAQHNQLTDMVASMLFNIEPTSELASRTGWFTFSIMPFIWAGIIRTLFPKDVGYVILTIFAVPSILIAAASLTASPEVYITFGAYFRMLIPLFAVVSLYIVVRVLWNRRKGAGSILVGIVALIFAAIYDFIRYERSEFFLIDASSIALLIFCVLQSLQIGRSHTKSLEATSVLAGKLQALNQSLELQVQDRTLSLKTANETLMQQAMTDPLTNLLNRRAFKAVFEREVSKVNRYERPFVLAMVDIDLFKVVNDTWGHDIGDKVLVAIAAELKSIGRETDVVARYGGEEFAILLLETDFETGRNALERIRSNIESLSIEVNGSVLGVTASFGMTDCIKSEQFDDVIKRADVALYQAKDNGRNQLVFVN